MPSTTWLTPGFFTLNVCDRAAGDTGSFFVIEVVITGMSRSLDVDFNGVIEPLKDGLLTLRHEFGFSGAVLIDGAVGEGCIRARRSRSTASSTIPELERRGGSAGGSDRPPTSAAISNERRRAAWS